MGYTPAAAGATADAEWVRVMKEPSQGSEKERMTQAERGLD